MPRPRDRQSATGLLPRMEARTRKDGQITYRYHPRKADGSRGKPINLGTDKALAINLLVRSSTGAACGAARGDFFRKSTRASIGLRRVGSHDFQQSRNP